MNNTDDNFVNDTVSSSPAAADSGVPYSLPSGNDPAMLPLLKGWNWGAFFFNWTWLIPIKIELAIAAFWLNGMTCGLALIALSIYLGINGNQLAWENQHYRDIEEFKAVQKKWMIAGIICVGIPLVIALVLMFAFGGIFMASLLASLKCTS